jgi:hypothetical protein
MAAKRLKDSADGRSENKKKELSKKAGKDGIGRMAF